MNSDADWFAEQLSSKFPAFSFHAAHTAEQAQEWAAETEILIGLAPQLSNSLIASMPRLKWIHALTTGVDNLIASPSLKPDIVLSNSSGFHGPQMSELAILLMLSAARDFPRMLENQKMRIWERWPQSLLQGKEACIVGIGSIAEALAARLSVFGMTLIGVSDGRAQVPGFTRIYRRDELAIAAGQADFLILLVPYSQAAHHLIDDSILSVMRPDAILINLSRGGCVDEMALQKHMQAGTIRAAALDVFAQEPLPPDNALWSTPGVTITPHIGGMSDTYREQVAPVVTENLNAWSEGGGAALPNRIYREEQE